jgi:hypothetical protein
MLIVMIGIAPGIHAMRVANGADQNEHSTISPDAELTLTRCLEMVCESIPGSVLQVGQLLQSYKDEGSVNKAALGSIVVSALTTGFSAATISFE